MRSLMKSVVLAGWLLLVLLSVSAPVLGQNCYKHPKAELLLRDCTGHVETICFDSAGGGHVVDIATWISIKAGAPGCEATEDLAAPISKAHPLRGQSDDDVSTDEDDW